VLVRRKPEDTAEGCRRLAHDDRSRAAGSASEHIRRSLEGSADAWIARAALLQRLEASFNARAEAIADGLRQHSSEGQDHG
jgi:hypothetical protein